MKKLLLLFVLISGIAFGQNIDVKRTKSNEFKASNGITYKVGDVIKLGRGSMDDGRFNYLQMGGFGNTMSVLASATGGFNNVYGMSGERNMAGQNVVIKKIKNEKSKRGSERTFFVVGIGSITNANLFIEDAIATCEIENCKKKPTEVKIVETTDKFDKLKKLKELKDSGVLSDAEYEAEKAKILAE